jgi:hypothetical protein
MRDCAAKEVELVENEMVLERPAREDGRRWKKQERPLYS